VGGRGFITAEEEIMRTDEQEPMGLRALPEQDFSSLEPGANQQPLELLSANDLNRFLFTLFAGVQDLIPSGPCFRIPTSGLYSITVPVPTRAMPQAMAPAAPSSSARIRGLTQKR
jgi:hypothetical protein